MMQPLSFHKRGRGHPCFLLHGGPGFDSMLFAPVLSTLSKKLQLYAIDYCDRPPGHQFTMNGLVEDLEALRQSEKLDHILLLGHSAGGFLSLEYARRFPERVAGQILVSTAADVVFAKETEENLKRFPRALQGLKDYLASSRTDEDYKQMSLKYLEFAIVPSMRVKAEQVFSGMNYSAACFEQLKRNYLPNYSVKAALPQLTMPTLVIAGKDDLVIPPRYSQELAALMPNAQFLEISGCNHFPFIEAPEEFCGVIEHWLEKTKL